MISPRVEAALLALQKRALSATDTYELSRIERALDELLRNPSNEAISAARRVRSAMGHAFEAIERRREIAPVTSLNAEVMERGMTDGYYAVIDILEWLQREPRLGRSERILLCALAEGHESGTMADAQGVPVPRMRERISRARNTARRLWADTIEVA